MDIPCMVCVFVQISQLIMAYIGAIPADQSQGLLCVEYVCIVQQHVLFSDNVQLSDFHSVSGLRFANTNCIAVLPARLGPGSGHLVITAQLDNIVCA